MKTLSNLTRLLAWTYPLHFWIISMNLISSVSNSSEIFLRYIGVYVFILGYFYFNFMILYSEYRHIMLNKEKINMGYKVKCILFILYLIIASLIGMWIIHG